MACCLALIRVFLVFTIVVVFAGALVLPWYQTRQTMESSFYSVQCSSYTQAWYLYTHCQCEVFSRDCDQWINEQGNTGFQWWDDWSDVSNQRIVYISLWAAVALSGLWLLMQLCTSHPGISVFVLVLSLLAAFSFFALPLAVRADFPRCERGPCESLFGSATYGNLHWNPWYGWAASWLAAPLLLLLSVFTCCEHRRRNNAAAYTDIERNIVYVTGPAWGSTNTAPAAVLASTPLSSAASSGYSSVSTGNYSGTNF